MPRRGKNAPNLGETFFLVELSGSSLKVGEKADTGTLLTSLNTPKQEKMNMQHNA